MSAEQGQAAATLAPVAAAPSAAAPSQESALPAQPDQGGAPAAPDAAPAPAPPEPGAKKVATLLNENTRLERELRTLQRKMREFGERPSIDSLKGDPEKALKELGIDPVDYAFSKLGHKEPDPQDQLRARLEAAEKRLQEREEREQRAEYDRRLGEQIKLARDQIAAAGDGAEFLASLGEHGAKVFFDELAEYHASSGRIPEREELHDLARRYSSHLLDQQLEAEKTLLTQSKSYREKLIEIVRPYLKDAPQAPDAKPAAADRSTLTTELLSQVPATNSRQRSESEADAEFIAYLESRKNSRAESRRG